MLEPRLPTSPLRRGHTLRRTRRSRPSTFHRILLPLVALLLRQSPIATAQNCPMDIWVFETLDRCDSINPPNAVGVVYADNECHSIETQVATISADYALFPGNYRAECTASGFIHFYESGCVTDTCSSSALGTCERDNASAASLYSRLQNPQYLVQNKGDASPGGFYTCFRLAGPEKSATFVIFGDCSAPGCSIDGVVVNPAQPVAPVVPPTVNPVWAPTTLAPTSVPVTAPVTVRPTPQPSDGPTIAPTNQPTVALTNQPTVAPSGGPTSEPTLGPTVFPTDEPTWFPTRRPTDAPTNNPTVSPTNEPTDTPTVEPTDTPTFSPVEVGEPTRPPSTEVPTVSPTTAQPSLSPTTAPSTLAPSIAPRSNTRSEIIAVALAVSPMMSKLPNDMDDVETGLQWWKDATQRQITQSAENSGIEVWSSSIANITQVLSDNENDESRRALQEEDGVLKIFFELSMRYSRSDPEPPSLLEIFNAAFDTERDRSNYLLKLVASIDELFDSIRLIQVVDNESDGPFPSTTLSPSASPDSGDGNGGVGNDDATASPDDGSEDEDDENADRDPDSVVAPTEGNGEDDGSGMIAGGVVGALLVVVILGGFVTYRRRRDGKISSKMGQTKDDTPSSFGEPIPSTQGSVDPTPEQQRWTNEILVDPSADDVSTLGGSVAPGLNLGDKNNDNDDHGDEPTASVNLDYDYGKEQYPTDLENSRSMTGETSTSAPTTFTTFSKLGMLGDSVFEDDNSFERQYADEDGDDSVLQNKVKPFEVRAPPGLLGMVVDTPHGSVPVVRAIKPDSVLTGRVLIGDRLISVDNKDVTSMTALQVSSLISLRQNQQRLLVFVRQERLNRSTGAPVVASDDAMFNPENATPATAVQ